MVQRVQREHTAPALHGDGGYRFMGDFFQPSSPSDSLKYSPIY